MVGSLGRPEGVVCNAGFARPGYIEEIPDEVIRRLVEVNYLGAVYAVRAVLPHLRRGGFVSLTSSVLGYMGAFGSAPYAATKHALVGFAESLTAIRSAEIESVAEELITVHSENAA